MNKQQIGGRAYKNGVMLQNNSYVVKAFYDEKNNLRCDLSKRTYTDERKWVSFIKKIPIIRGIFAIMFLLGSFLKESVQSPKKNWWFILLILLNLVLLSTKFIQFDESSLFGENSFINFTIPSLFQDTTILNFFELNISFNQFLCFFVVILIVFFGKTIMETFRYHGAEHKTIHYYEADLAGEINSYSRIHRRCGTNLMFYQVTLMIILSLFKLPIPQIIRDLFAFGLSYELIMATPDFLLPVVQVFQRFTTKEPSDKHIAAAKLALDTLLEQG